MTTSLVVGHRVGCRVAAGAFTGPGTIVNNLTLGLVSIAVVEQPSTWWWGQCNIEGPLAAGSLAGICLLALLALLCAVRCVCRCCCKRREARAVALLFPDQRLLSVQAVQPARP